MPITQKLAREVMDEVLKYTLQATHTLKLSFGSVSTKLSHSWRILIKTWFVDGHKGDGSINHVSIYKILNLA